MAENLLVNGGFETGDLTGWIRLSGGNVVDSSDAAWVEPHSGSWLLRLGDGSKIQSTPFDVSTFGSVWIELWNNSYEATRKAFVSVSFDGGEPVQLGTVSSGGQAWAQDRFEVSVPAGASTASLVLSCYTSDVRIDDVIAGGGCSPCL